MIPEKTTTRLILRYSTALLILALSLGLIHKSIYIYFLADVSIINPIWKVYAFLVFMSMVTYGLVLLVHYVIQEYAGFAFLASIVIKMFLSLWFLFPLIKSEIANKTPDVANFFLPFFIFLVVEVWFSIRLLQNK